MPAIDSTATALQQLPTGPAWDAATRERNWAVIQIVPRPTEARPDRTDKVPIDPATRRWCGHEQATVLTLAEAFDVARRARVYHPSCRFVLGYMPRPGSAMVCGDVDACAMRAGKPPGWLTNNFHPTRPIMTYTEWSPSGKGLRVLLERTHLSLHTGEYGGVALYAEGGKALTITFDRLDGDDWVTSFVEPSFGTQMAFLWVTSELKRRAEAAARPPRQVDQLPEPRGASEAPDYWFQDLDEEEQLERVKEMLAALPEGGFPERDANAGNSWFRIMCAVHDHFEGGDEAYAIFDEWSETHAGGNYDAGGNEYAWESLGKSKRPGDPITIGTLIRLAQQHGWRRPLYTFSGSARRYSPEELAELDAGFLRGLAKRGYSR